VAGATPASIGQAAPTVSAVPQKAATSGDWTSRLTAGKPFPLDQVWFYLALGLAATVVVSVLVAMMLRVSKED